MIDLIVEKRKRDRKLRLDMYAKRLLEAEDLFLRFKELTPYHFRPFAKSFKSFVEYEQWKRNQKNPWYR